LEPRCEPAAVDAVLNRLNSRRLLDDARAVQQAIASNQGRRAVPAVELRRRLEARGADSAALALIEMTEEPNLGPLLARFERSDRGRARAYRFLASRGFAEEEILSALERYLAEPGSSD